MPIRDLAAHQAPYVTVAELAEYWAVSRRQIYKRIESGALEAIRLGSHLYRVRTCAARECERRATVICTVREETHPETTASPAPRSDAFPPKIGLQPVPRRSGTSSVRSMR